MSDEVEVVLTNGQKVGIRSDEMVASAFHKKSLLVYFSLFCMFTLTAAYPSITPFPLWVKAMVHIPSIIIAVLVWAGTFLVFAMLAADRKNPRLYSAFPSLIAAFVADQTAMRIATIYGVYIPDSLKDRIGITLFNFLLSELVVLAVANFVVKDVISKKRMPQEHIQTFSSEQTPSFDPAPAPAQEVEPPAGDPPLVAHPDLATTIRIDRTDICVAKIRLASAHGNYLDIVYDGGKIFTNMNISDFCAMLPDAIGCRIHRSHWVAHEEIASVSKSGRVVVVTCHSGPVIPVARGRQKDFLRDHAAWQRNNP